MGSQCFENKFVMDEIKDKVVILLGITGVGKSSFINSITKKKDCKVGDTAKACTEKILQVDVSNDGYNYYFVDTPGLDGVKYWGICGSQDKYLKNLEASAEKGTVDFNLTVLEGQGHEIEDIVFNNEYDLNGEMQNPLIWALSQSRSS